MRTTTNSTVRIIRCPRCSRSTRYDSANLNRPFCSARCKNEDVIDWAEERFVVPVHTRDDEETNDYL